MAGQSTLMSHLFSAVSRMASHTFIILNVFLLPQSLMTHVNWIHQMRCHLLWMTNAKAVSLYCFISVRILKAFTFLIVKLQARLLFVSGTF